MEEVVQKKEETKESIEELLTEDYNDKKYLKKKKKEAKKQKKLEKKKRKKEKTVQVEKKPSINFKRVIIEASIIILLIISIMIFIFFFIPTIKLNGQRRVVVEYGNSFENPKCYASFQGKDISDKIWYEGEVNLEKLGKYILTCKVRKNRFIVSRDRIVEVVDTKKPTIELKGDKDKVICPNTEYEEEGYTAVDNYDGDISKSVVVEKLDNKISYKVSDSSGNKEMVERTITKEDKTAPVITLNGNETITVIVGNKYNEQGATAIDNCDSDLTSGIITEGTVDSNTVGTYTITYKVSDKAGNIEVKERKVVVQKGFQKVGSSLGCGGAGVIYLTFDDGPNDNYTPTILNILKKYGVKATFFVTAAGSDSLIAREHNEGHAVAVHTWTHNYNQIYASSDAFWSDFNKVQERIKRITGSETKLMRFPGGASNTVSKVPMSQLANEAISKGYNYIDWNISSGDAGGTTDPSQECRNVTGSLSKSRGNVVLMHDIKKHTMNAIECIIKGGLDNGYTFAVLDTNVICRHATKR